MITLAFRFPGGRYHATPWGHQVNEGLVEWPPCPWRLLRACIASGYSRLGWGRAGDDGIVAALPDEARALLEQLADALPSYTLPPASVAHSRHYMPTSGGKTTLVMDTWVNVRGELLVHWPVVLDAPARALLGRLVESLNYLGRSESWVEGRLLSDEVASATPNCMPLATEASTPTQGGGELVDLLSPVPAADYAAWRALQVPPLETGGRRPTAKMLKEHAKKVAPYPEDLVAALQTDTAVWKGFGWNLPPGSHTVQYRRPPEALQARFAPARAERGSPMQDLVLLALATQSGNLSALPTLARTLPQAELLHKALVGRSGQGGAVSSVLSGCNAERRPLRGHTHAHILPVDLDDDGRLDHVLLWAPGGFDAAAMRAIRAVRRTWMKGGAGELRVALAGLGRRDAMRETPGVETAGLDRVLGPASGAKEWVSLTPFVPPRHMKRSGRNTLEGQVQAELAGRGLPPASRVTLLDRTTAAWSRVRPFVRVRARGGQPPPVDVGLALRIELSTPVAGPLCLGYASHFGLGLFTAVDGQEDKWVAGLAEFPADFMADRNQPRRSERRRKL